MERKVLKDQWNNLEDSKVCTSYCEINLKMEKSDFHKLSLGFISSNMEDKWFIYEANTEIYFYRSWTNKCAAILLYKEQDEVVLLTGIRINPNLTSKLTVEQIIEDVLATIKQVFHVNIIGS